MPNPSPPQQGYPSPWQLGPAVWLATGGWVGFIRKAPGTFGTLVGLPLAWGLEHLPPLPHAVCVVAICLLGIPICTAAARRLGGAKDPGCIVFDEIASVPLTFFLVPINGWLVMLAGFLLHRLFDIAKPPPARQLEALPEGFGIMADDWIAGLYSNLALRGVIWLAAVSGISG